MQFIENAQYELVLVCNDQLGAVLGFTLNADEPVIVLHHAIPLNGLTPDTAFWHVITVGPVACTHYPSPTTVRVPNNNIVITATETAHNAWRRYWRSQQSA